MDRNTAINKLADLIEANPECTSDIDNDAWYMIGKDGEEITNSEHWGYSTHWYGHSTSYGFAISEAFLTILNRQHYNIEARAV